MESKILCVDALSKIEGVELIVNKFHFQLVLHHFVHFIEVNMLNGIYNYLRIEI